MDQSNLRTRAFKVLIAEDNDINLILMRALFATLFPSATLLEAKDGEIAVDKTNDSPDIILMDLHMPFMNGFEAAAAIRKLPHMEKTPIIALTASNSETEKQACLDAGMNDIMLKPVNKATLETFILKYLRD